MLTEPGQHRHWCVWVTRGRGGGASYNINASELVSELVSWCFEPSQPQRIVSRLRETFIQRYIVERTNKAEIKPQEQSERTESCRENSWNEIQLKGP